MRTSKVGTICRLLMVLLLGPPATSLRGEPLVVEPGFAITQVADWLRHPTQIAFGDDGRLYVATQDGIVLAFEYGPNGVKGPARTIASGVGVTLLGIAISSDGVIYASSNEGPYDSGFLSRLVDADEDGFYETEKRFVTDLPNRGHHNDQLALDQNLLYVGMGSRTDDGESDNVQPIPAATVLVVDLDNVDFDSNQNLPSVYAYGFRNPFGIALDERGRIWVGDNGRDTPLEPDKLHLVAPGAHHGFPVELAPLGAVPPVLTLGLGTSADGLDFYPRNGLWGPCFEGDLFIVRFDFERDDPLGAGRDLVRVRFDPSDPEGRTAMASVFAKGFPWPPLDVEVDPFGNLLVAVYGSYGDGATGSLWRTARTSASADVNCDSGLDLEDFAVFANCFTKPAELVTSSCRTADLDDDGDVDLSDFSLLQSAL